MITELSLAALLALGGGLDTVDSLAAHWPGGGPSALERAALASARAPELELQRAGAPVAPGASTDAVERTALRDAQAAAGDLEQQRGGDLELSDRDVAIIAVTAAFILLLVIIL